jgi:predicted  nucleic acid-binding Zn-ribbon protein
MSLFTKIFIVLVMVLSVLLVALVVPFVVNTDTYKAKWRDETSRRQVAEFNAAARENDLATFINTLNETIRQRDDQIARLQASVNTKDTEIQNLQAEVIQLQNANQDVRAQLARLSTGLQQQTQINGMLQDEIKDRREKMLVLQTRNVELNDKVRELLTTVDTLTSQVRLQKEQYADLRSQNEELERKLEAAGPKVAQSQGVAFDPKVAIRGLVTDVRPVGDDTLIALNVGSNDGVRENMRFMLHRGDKFLGNAVIVKLDTNSCAARVTLKRGEISANDEALAGSF